MDQPKNCYIDCSDTFFSGLNTGIQRVVKNITTRMEAIGIFHGYRFIPVITVGSEIFIVKGNLADNYPVTRTVNSFLGNLRNMVDFIFSIRNEDTSSRFAAEEEAFELDPAKIPSGLHWRIVSACRNIIPFILRFTILLDTPFPWDSKVTLKKGDTFFVSDSFWNVNGLPALEKAVAKQARIVLLIYDVIPVTHPEFFSDINCMKFNQYLPAYLKVVDGVIAISRSTMDGVIQYCQKAGIGRDIAFDYFYLGADFSSEIPSDDPSSPLVENLGQERFFLMVGTIEPRKNHVYVLDAFEKLWQEGSNFKLCIVGKVGWKCDAIVKRMTSSAYFNKNLFVFNDLNDADLKYLLKRSCAVVIASIVEGFGLPVVEAMHFQKTLLASDIPVFREIGKDYPLYFPLDDNKILSELVFQVANGSLKSESICHGWMSWDESVHELMEKVIAIAERADAPKGTQNTALA